MVMSSKRWTEGNVQSHPRLPGGRVSSVEKGGRLNNEIAIMPQTSRIRGGVLVYSMMQQRSRGAGHVGTLRYCQRTQESCAPSQYMCPWPLLELVELRVDLSRGPCRVAAVSREAGATDEQEQEQEQRMMMRYTSCHKYCRNEKNAMHAYLC